MDTKKDFYIFHDSFKKLLLLSIPIFIILLACLIQTFWNNQHKDAILLFNTVLLIFSMQIFGLKIPSLIIIGDKILTRGMKFWENKYNIYLFNEVDSYWIGDAYMTILFHSGKAIHRVINFYSKDDRELLKQLLAEKIPVKPS
jgi:hypothetical protein